MAGRPGRDRLNLDAGDLPPRRSTALLASHIALAALLGAGGVAVAGASSGDAMFVDVIGLLLLAELVLLGVAGAIAVLLGRFGPLVLVDAIVATPAVAAISRADPGSSGLLTLAIWGIAIAALGAACAAATRVRDRAIERIAVVVALLGVAIAFAGSWLAMAAPLLVLAVVAVPELPHLAPAERSRGPAPAKTRAAPDAAAVLRRRDPGPPGAG